MAFFTQNSEPTTTCSLRKAYCHFQGICPYDRSAAVTPLKIHEEQLEIDCRQGSKGQVARGIEHVLEIPREGWAHEQDIVQLNDSLDALHFISWIRPYSLESGEEDHRNFKNLLRHVRPKFDGEHQLRATKHYTIHLFRAIKIKLVDVGIPERQRGDCSDAFLKQSHFDIRKDIRKSNLIYET